MEKRISGTTGLFTLLGSPVGHSGSPAMYNFSFQQQGLDYAYLAFDVKKDQMAEAMDMLRLFKVRGSNVTMPCKTVAATLVDDLSPAAKIVGAINVIVNDDGKLTGHITDGLGFVRNLKETGVTIQGKKLVVLGAGGAATALQVQCALDGAASISIFNQDDDFYANAEATQAKLKTATPNVDVTVYPLADQAKLKAEIAAADILVNATVVGMKPLDGQSLIDPSWLQSDLVVADTVYNPLKTKLIEDAEATGCTVAPGKGMLLWQGAAAYTLFTGKDMPTDEYQAYEAKQAVKQH
ncbi:shikimate dehydrogenase [Lactiplantibacillus mudanjiangensis]|uniref:Shikimate dehydrogenase (NADP(+)) n=1 Tax=Lactiplantibacillus mudanjiangensis TaxID=1296538 RepID=A0A660E844_9LACO|nr:shikimate dehydrogenase [Lactiplantibacillus mudanjiangensis]VDG22889.1 shikimate 5-dehydrogenase [Lactobacillus plantarum JDM1] [Lactiplantibacillus mudanjiangensis]VDG29251.1 shikimate 5-dehydrogenase [Lactobacillus plantarum JDM1] [Lactiplantibacillus mudanjiangensis]VDG31777.1 shikimate 5-dehydrogenase [Lactobacillus plantarum JDM1] [Lactiplantibacillus mudanjiangensis]